MENCTTYIRSIVENGWWEDACSSSYHPIPPVSASGHKLQKPSKESGIFQSLGTIKFVLFAKRQNQRGAWPNRTQTHFRRRKHTAGENQRYRSSAVKLASSSRTLRSLFSHPQLGTAVVDRHKLFFRYIKRKKAMFCLEWLVENWGGMLLDFCCTTQCVNFVH